MVLGVGSCIRSLLPSSGSKVSCLGEVPHHQKYNWRMWLSIMNYILLKQRNFLGLECVAQDRGQVKDMTNKSMPLSRVVD